MAPCLSFLLILCFFSKHIHACSQTERTSLLAFALTLSSPSLNWTTSSNCCHWEGITCNQDGFVTHLSLPSKGLRQNGSISPFSSLQNLTHLTYLNLSHNSLYGSPAQAGFSLSLNHLEILDLSYNLLSGKLPISPLSKSMRMLDLSSNSFDGDIPSPFFQQAWNLTSFNVSNNKFRGSLPSSMCFTSPLVRVLDFSFNNFNGSISPRLGECSKLKVFRAGYNNLSGILPEEMYNATTLEEISLPRNSLYGILSDGILNLTNLAILDLHFNEFNGMLPLHFGKLSKLKLLLVQFNYLKGYMPSSLMNCTSLVELNLGSNIFEGNLSLYNFSKFVSLSKLDLLRNQFTGTFPTSLYACKSLKAIRLGANDIEGQIQPDILSLESLSYLSLSFNRLTNLTGAIKILQHCKGLVFLSLGLSFEEDQVPADLGMLDIDGFQNLRFLDLSKNELTGQIPIWLIKLKKLEVLNLHFNKFTGQIPSQLGTLPRLFHLGLGANLISGEFPRELCSLPMLVSQNNLSSDDLELPIYFTTDGKQAQQYNSLLFFPVAIVLHKNIMTGSIPIEIVHSKLLRVLDLGNNFFSGKIPDQTSNLKNLEVMDLSVNHFSGNIPVSLTSLNFLAVFNVSYNKLEGQIPTSTQFQSFGASAFEGNPNLCGLPLPNECQQPLPNDGLDGDDNNSEDQVPWFIFPVVLGFFSGFWAVCGSLIFIKTWRYAYFRFLNNAYDSLYVMIAVGIKRMKRRLYGS